MRPVLVVNPRTDDSFVEYVREQVDCLLDSDPLSLQRRLRERHPGTTVHARLLSSEPSTVCYTYRDGHWMPADAATVNEER